jgi:Ca-activated chloride channel family protein
MLGQYDAAIAAYQRALSARPDWHAAEQNLEIAQLRKLSLAPPEDDFGGTGGMLEADEIVFNQEGRNFDSATEQVVDAADQPMDDKSMRAMWLRKVETRPSEFLAVRFRYQQATRVQTTPVGKSPTTGEDND